MMLAFREGCWCSLSQVASRLLPGEDQYARRGWHDYSVFTGVLHSVPRSPRGPGTPVLPAVAGFRRVSCLNKARSVADCIYTAFLSIFFSMLDTRRDTCVGE